MVLVNVNACTSLTELLKNENNILVYPNPISGIITIISSGNLNLVLTDQLGRVLKTFSLNDLNNRNYSIENLPSGIYFVKCFDSEKIINEKIIISK